MCHEEARDIVGGKRGSCVGVTSDINKSKEVGFDTLNQGKKRDTQKEISYEGKENREHIVLL